MGRYGAGLVPGPYSRGRGMSLLERVRELGATATAAALLVALAVAVPSSPAAATSETFGPHGYGKVLVVPVGVVSVHVTVVGAPGGSGCAPGGHGAELQAFLNVKPGDELWGEVGAPGEPGETVLGAAPCAGGVGKGAYDLGSGLPGSAGLGGGGSSGGGATWIALPPSECCAAPGPWYGKQLLALAGGGGGAGYGTGASGGDAGAVGLPGHAAAGFGGAGGGGGSASAAGTGGNGAFGSECVGSGGSGWPGAEGHGGQGGSAEAGEAQESNPGGGGGGGGGWFGGAGGGGGAHYEGSQASARTCAGAGGGGGGSSYIAREGALVAVATIEPPQIKLDFSQQPPPVVTIASPTPGARYEQGRPVRAQFECKDSAGSPGMKFCIATATGAGGQESLGGGAPLPTGRTGRFSFTVAAGSQDGLEAHAAGEYTVVADGTLPGGGAPSLGRVTQSRARWRGGSSRPRLGSSPRTRAGTTISFSLSAAARVRVVFARRRAGAGAVAMTVSAPRGRSRLFFDGLLPDGRRLAPGSYTATLTAVGSNGVRSAPRTLRFAVL